MQVIKYKQNIVQHNKTKKIPCPPETRFLQYIGDKRDHELATTDSKNTHDFGAIAVANGNFSIKTLGGQKYQEIKK